MSISSTNINLFEEYKNGSNYIFSKEDFERILSTIKNTRVKKKMCSYFLWLKDNRKYIEKEYFSDFNDIKEWTPEIKKEYYLSKGLKNYNTTNIKRPRIASLITSKAGILWKELDENERNKYTELSKKQDNNNIDINTTPKEKKKRGRPKKNTLPLNVSDAAIDHCNNQTNLNNNKNQAEPEHHVETEIKVEEILFKGNIYWLDINNMDIYDPTSEEIIGKKKGVNIYIN